MALFFDDQGGKTDEVTWRAWKITSKYTDEKKPLTHSKQKEIFQEITNRTMGEIRDLSSNKQY